MRRFASKALGPASGFAALGALVIWGGLSSSAVTAATGGGELQEVAASGAARSLGDSADLMLRFVQEDGPESGHVRVELTPEIRPLTVMEARVAAQKGFLAALNEPGLGDNLKRITVVVRLMPSAHPSPDAASQTIVYRHAGGDHWSIVPEGL